PPSVRLAVRHGPVSLYEAVTHLETFPIVSPSESADRHVRGIDRPSERRPLDGWPRSYPATGPLLATPDCRTHRQQPSFRCCDVGDRQIPMCGEDLEPALPSRVNVACSGHSCRI